MSQRGRRILAVVVLIVVLGGIAVADRIDGPASDTTPAAPSTALAVDEVAPQDARSSAWFCAGGTAASGTAAPTLAFVNHGGGAVSGTVHAVGSSGSTAAAAITIPARGTATMALASLVQGPEVASTVLLDGGGVGVWESVAGPSGWSVAPCASATSAHWSFAQGSTATGDSLSLVLYNPTATDAVASITLVTSSAGVVAPAAYQGIGVPPEAIVVANVADHVQNDPAIGAVVSTLSGTVVAVERQVTQSTGLSLVAGNPQETTANTYALSVDPTGGAVSFRLLDPSGVPARVSAAVGLQHGTAAPIAVTVPAQGTTLLQTAGQTRIPLDTPYSVVFSSSVPVVVSREVDAPASPEAPHVGISPAVSAGRERWLLPPLPPPGAGLWYFGVVDLAGRPVTVTVRTPGPHGWASSPDRTWRVTPSAPLVMGPNPGPPLGVGPVEVIATGPVAVELDARPAGSPGVVVVPALGLG
jgi:hypothetical protein